MYLTTSSLETFGFCFLYSCSCSYFSVRKLLRSSFCLSDRFSSAPRRFSSVAMLLSSSGVMIFLFLGGFDFLEELTGGRPDQIQPCGSYPWFLGYARHHSRMRRRGQEPQGGSEIHTMIRSALGLRLRRWRKEERDIDDDRATVKNSGRS